MATGKWSPDLSVGIVSLDAQHQKLFRMFEELDEAILGEKDREVIGAVLDGLLAYTREHFVREEKLFAQTKYRDAPAHALEHEAFVRKAEALRADHLAGQDDVAPRALEFMSSWLREHIGGTDRKYAAHLNSRGIK